MSIDKHKPQFISLGGEVKANTDVVISPTSIQEKPLSQEALECKALTYLLSIQNQILSFNGKKGYNPHIWLKERGVTKLISLLRRNPNDQQALADAIKIEFEEPKIELFESLYEPPSYSPTR